MRMSSRRTIRRGKECAFSFSFPSVFVSRLWLNITIRSRRSLLQLRGLQRPRLQSRQFNDLRRVEAFGKDHPAPQSRRVFGDVTISREPALPQCDVTQVVICILPAFDQRAERRQIILWRDAAGADPDFIWHPSVGAAELRDLADGAVKIPP